MTNEISRDELVLILGLILEKFGFGQYAHFLDGIQFKGNQLVFKASFHGVTAEIVADVYSANGNAVLALKHIKADGVETIQLDRPLAAAKIMEAVNVYPKFIHCFKDDKANLEFQILPGHGLSVDQFGIVGETLLVDLSA